MIPVAEGTEILSGLPGDPPYPLQFNFSSNPMGSEGLVVRFTTLGNSWVGNFQRSYGRCEATLHHPNGSDFLIIAGGAVYTVNPLSRQLLYVSRRTILDWKVLTENNLFLFDCGGIFFAIGEAGFLWDVLEPLDCLNDLQESPGLLSGKYFREDMKRPLPFQLNLQSGKLSIG